MNNSENIILKGLIFLCFFISLGVRALVQLYYLDWFIGPWIPVVAEIPWIALVGVNLIIGLSRYTIDRHVNLEQLHLEDSARVSYYLVLIFGYLILWGMGALLSLGI